MTNYNQVIEAATQLVDQAANYAAKPTKAESKRMRASINTIQKAAVAAKKELVAADKGA